jgi:hypothetical protein
MPHLVSDAHAEHTLKELMRMLCMRIAHQFLMRMLSMF